MTIVKGKSINEWISAFPDFGPILNYTPFYWGNPYAGEKGTASQEQPLQLEDIQDAEERLKRFAPFIAAAYKETEKSEGMIESPLKKADQIKARIEEITGQTIPGAFYVKLDSHLPISGSIKGRGGIYEVLKYAEKLLLEHHLLSEKDDYSKIAEEKYRDFFSQYTILVGSTGNLGLSIGVISAKLGFRVVVHMSADAKQWKKDLLRERGVQVVEHPSDYSKAVKEGRKEAENDPKSYFIDDENSKDLFLGYAVAAIRLKKQLKEQKIQVSPDNPLHVYLPCGVGGGPGGVAFGLKAVFGDAVKCYFAEPTHSPCMLIGMMTRMHNEISVNDFGLDNQTAADGLAVGRASGFVGKVMEPLLEGIFTVSDEQMFRLIAEMADAEGIHLEPSAVTGLMGPSYVVQNNPNITEGHTHIIWATGGSMVPDEIKEAEYQKGLAFKRKSDVK
ncbi:D-serine ammonia-lyase [Oceanobacillus sp. J11TS1]|uniref:D-serine ammonia-lyase n=1 Tax=Oceanobacillus sp. J11TS1 TaxID=2807191 RepID=UPI001B17EE0C|nr:D-serine ammonia-lyase [Oceanobacillus sp. J11TS1]GIO22887.1 putative D-serine dehydratase [Oceanobacillus sp. J11TS1]